MKLDPYAPCPGGRAKKLKFCCPDLHKELERMNELLVQRDFTNVMPLLDQLAPMHPDCACLTVFRLTALAGLGRHEEALELAAVFNQREPENPTAITHWALELVMTGRASEAWEALIDACERAVDDENSFSLGMLGPGGMLLLIEHLAAQGAMPTAVLLDTLWAFYFERSGEGGELIRERHRLRQQMLGDTRVPLMLRSVILRLGPRDTLLSQPLVKEAALVTAGYSAFSLVMRGKWKSAVAEYKRLAGDPVRYPSFLEFAARLEVGLGRFADACQTLERLMNTEGLSEQTRLDAIMLRALISGDPLGDAIPNEVLHYTLSEDAYPLQVIDSSRSVVPTPRGEMAVTDENGVAPLRDFACLDRPQLTASETPTAETLPQFVAVGVLYGKQTDRPARLEVIPIAHRRGQGETMIRELFAEKIISCVNEPIPEMPKISRTESFAAPPFFYSRTTPQTSEQLEEIVSVYYHGAFLSLWCDNSLGLLDGRKPSEVASDGAYRERLLAAIRFVREIVGAPFGPSVAATLRERLGLDAEDVIVLGDIPDDVSLLEIIPPWRWGQLDVASLPSPILEGLFIQVLQYRDQATATTFAEEVLARPQSELPVELRLMAFTHMKDVAMSEHNPDEALAWVARGKSEAVANKLSPLTWEVHRATILLLSGRHHEAGPLINTLATNHADSPEVRPFLTWLSQVMEQAEAGIPAGNDGGDGLADDEASSSRLWTPDQGRPTAPPASGGAGGGSVIWTP